MNSRHVKITTESFVRYYDLDATVHVNFGERYGALPAQDVKVGQALLDVEDNRNHLVRITAVEVVDKQPPRWLHTRDHGLMCMESHAPVWLVKTAKPQPRDPTAADLEDGDSIIVTGPNGQYEIIQIDHITTTPDPVIQEPVVVSHHHELPSIQDKLAMYKRDQTVSNPQPEEVSAMKDNQIAELESRIATLEETLVATNEVVTQLQRSIVQLTADHIQRIFNDDVMIDSIAHRVLVAGANAIAHKAKSSKERAPELVVVEGYVPGALRVTLQDDQVLVEEQVGETQEWVSGEQMSEGMNDPAIQHVFGDLLIAYGAEFGRPYYVVDSVELENFRAATAKQAASIVKGVEAPVAPTTEAQVVGVRLTTSDQFGNQYSYELDNDALVDVEQADGSIVQYRAHELESGQVLLISRDEATVKETIVAVESLVG